MTTRETYLDGGGAFLGLVSKDGTYQDAVPVTVYCVDIEHDIVPSPDDLLVNLTMLGDWTSGQNGEVQKGTNSSWVNGLSLTPLQRYQAAAYLVTLTKYYQTGTKDEAFDLPIQRAIWRFTDTPGSTDTTVADENFYYNQALNYILSPAGQNFGKGQWAVISGLTDGSGNLSSTGIQTFVVEVSDVPEPGTSALLALGLCSAALFGRKRAKQ